MATLNTDEGAAKNDNSPDDCSTEAVAVVSGRLPYPVYNNDYAGAARIAAGCSAFAADEVDEWAADEARSCFNCRWRRWTTNSFTCMALPTPPPGKL